MAKLHSIAKKLGFKSNAEFYKMYPTKESYEMAKGGTVFPQIQSADGFFSMGYENVPAPYQNGSFQKGGQLTEDELKWLATQKRGWETPENLQNSYITKRNSIINDLGNLTSDQKNQLATYMKGTGFWTDLLQGITPDTDLFNSKPKGSKLALGGYAGFGEGHPFPYQPRMPKNGAEAYGRPTYGSKWIAQVGGSPTSYYDTDIFSNKINTYTGVATPNSGAGYQFPIAPNAPTNPMNFNGPGGMYNVNTNFNTQPGQQAPHQMGMIGQQDTTKPASNKLDQFVGYKKMGGAPCYNCGGSKMEKGGSKKYASILKLDPSDPATRDQLIPSFTQYLKEAALGATMEEMNSMQLANGGTGYTEEFPYAMPYEYKEGGHWIQKAVNPKHKGYCTPMTKATCTPRRKALARTFKKHHGFHQEGGTPDAMQEAKWQAIIELTNQGITDPEQIATTLNEEGIYHTDPNEVAQYLQSGQDEAETPGQPEESPDYARYGAAMFQKGGNWDFTPDYRQSEKIGQLKGALDKKGISYKDMSDEQIVKLGLDNHLINQSEDHNNSGYDPYGQNPYGNYMQGAGNYGGWPGGAYKVKNKFNFYGDASDRFNPAQRSAMSNASYSGVVDPTTAKALKDAGMWYKQDIKNDIWNRTGLANGPKRIHTEFGFGDQPNMGLPQNSGIGTTWAGDKLRQLTGPGKKKQAKTAEEERYQANRANQDSNAFIQPQVAPGAYDNNVSSGEGQFYNNQAVNPSAWQNQVQDKNLIPWLNDTAGRLGVSPESLVNPQTPQTGPTPQQTPDMNQLQDNYRKAVEERDKIFKENNINKRGKHRNILGIKYQNGGNQYASLPPSAATMESLRFNPNDYNQDPNMDPENLPGYVPSPTLSNNEMVRAIEGNPADQIGSGISASSDAVRKKAGEADFWKDINTMQGATALAGIPHQERLRKKAKFDNRIENRVAPEQYRDRGDYTTNQGYFRPDQQNVGNMVTGAYGGAYQVGGQYDLTEEEIQMLRDGGYDLEYI